MVKISLIGYGNMGRHIAQQFLDLEGIKLHQVYSPSQKPEANPSVCMINDLNDLEQADLLIIAVSDDAIAHLAQQVPQGFCVVHTSGTVGMDALGIMQSAVCFIHFRVFPKIIMCHSMKYRFVSRPITKRR